MDEAKRYLWVRRTSVKSCQEDHCHGFQAASQWELRGGVRESQGKGIQAAGAESVREKGEVLRTWPKTYY